jgi:hypothetical protein
MVDLLKGEPNRVVVRFNDGKLLKGYTYDFAPAKDTFHLNPEPGKDKRDTLEIKVDLLKAIFFVKTLEGNPDYEEKKQFDEVKNPVLRGLKIKVRFFDGEVIRGTTTGYSKKRKGFFLFPVDPQSNNERIYVVANALRDVKVGSAAEEEEVPSEEGTAEAGESATLPTPALPPQAAIEQSPPEVRPYLEVVAGEKNRVIKLREREIIIGRSPKCGIRLAHKTGSRNHARLSFQIGKHHIEDLRSANGTYVNGKKVTKHALRNEDQIEIGGVKILFYEGSAQSP